MQDGTVLGDVQLPPWADGDPRKFVSLHRQVSRARSRQRPWYPEGGPQHHLSLQGGFLSNGGLATGTSEALRSGESIEGAGLCPSLAGNDLGSRLFQEPQKACASVL